MKTKFELSVSISPEEHEILAKAENILESVCLAFSEHDHCDKCPMQAICENKLGMATPANLLYHIRYALDIEGEE